MIQDSFNIESIVMETSHSMAWECKVFTHEFLGFRPIEDMDMKLQSNTWHIWLSQHSKTHIISLIQIWYKTTSRLKPKSMKTSDTRA